MRPIQPIQRRPIESALIILVLLLFAYLFWKQSQKGPAAGKPAGQKKRELLAQYQKRLETELAPLRDTPDAYRARKSALLKEINGELARNLFFDPDELRGVLQDLARKS